MLKSFLYLLFRFEYQHSFCLENLPYLSVQVYLYYYLAKSLTQNLFYLKNDTYSKGLGDTVILPNLDQ